MGAGDGKSNTKVQESESKVKNEMENRREPNAAAMEQKKT